MLWRPPLIHWQYNGRRRHYSKVLPCSPRGRNSLKIIADCSANGSGIVAEYTADELADDSDNEKRLEKAEKSADRTAGLKKRKRLPSSAKASAPSYVHRYVAAPLASYGNLAIPYSATHSQPSGGPSRRRSGSVAGPSLQRACSRPMFHLWRDGASADVLPQDAVPG